MIEVTCTDSLLQQGHPATINVKVWYITGDAIENYPFEVAIGYRTPFGFDRFVGVKEKRALPPTRGNAEPQTLTFTLDTGDLEPGTYDLYAKAMGVTVVNEDALKITK